MTRGRGDSGEKGTGSSSRTQRKRRARGSGQQHCNHRSAVVAWAQCSAVTGDLATLYLAKETEAQRWPVGAGDLVRTCRVSV